MSLGQPYSKNLLLGLLDARIDHSRASRCGQTRLDWAPVLEGNIAVLFFRIGVALIF
jgi:hypothetical protein